MLPSRINRSFQAEFNLSPCDGNGKWAGISIIMKLQWVCWFTTKRNSEFTVGVITMLLMYCSIIFIFSPKQFVLMNSFWFLQEKIAAKIFLANPKVFQQKMKLFWCTALLLQRGSVWVPHRPLNAASEAENQRIPLPKGDETEGCHKDRLPSPAHHSFSSLFHPFFWGIPFRLLCFLGRKLLAKLLSLLLPIFSTVSAEQADSFIFYLFFQLPVAA